jgi:hypothetical protein
MQEEVIRSMIREKLLDGDLPHAKCQITWFGPGSRQMCVACDGVIEPSQIECECEHPDGGVLRFHRECFALWDEIRQALA